MRPLSSSKTQEHTSGVSKVWLAEPRVLCVFWAGTYGPRSSCVGEVVVQLLFPRHMKA
jgi:hypothetical protein